MVNIKKNPVHKAKSRMEAESWIKAIGKGHFSNENLIIRRQGDEWHVYIG